MAYISHVSGTHTVLQTMEFQIGSSVGVVWVAGGPKFPPGKNGGKKGDVLPFLLKKIITQTNAHLQYLRKKTYKKDTV